MRTITREDLKGACFWFTWVAGLQMAGYPPDGVGWAILEFVLGLPLYVVIFHTGDKEPAAA